MSLAEKTLQLKQDFDDVYEAGKQAEYDAFWDIFQDNGNRTNYSCAFAGDGWANGTFNPKYLPIVITGGNAYRMFERFGNRNTIMAMTPDIVDFSQATSADYAFLNADIRSIEGDFGNCKSLTQTFSFPEGNIVKDINIKIAPTSVNNPFYRCVYLENLTFKEGSVIKCNGFDFQYSTRITHDSLINLLNVLEDKSADTSGTTWKLTLGSTNIAKLTDEELEIASNKGWYIN